MMPPPMMTTPARSGKAGVGLNGIDRWDMSMVQ